MSLFDVVPEFPGAVGWMMSRDRNDPDGDGKSAEVQPAVGRGRAAGRAMERMVGISDAAIRKNNRLFLLRQEHERWVKKRAMVAHNNMEDDMGKTALGVCDVCGEKGQLRGNHGKQMDSSCASMYAHLFNRLDLVAKVMVGENLVEKFLSRVATIYGKDEMIAVVQPYLPDSGPAGAEGQDCPPDAIAMAHPDLVKALFGDSRIISQAVANEAAIQVAAQLEDAQAASNCEACCELASLIDITKHAGLSQGTGSDQVAKAVAHLAAIIDELLEYAGEYASCPADLPFLIKMHGEELLNMRTNLQAKQDHINLLADQVSEAEQRLLADEQVFSRIREVIGADNAANGDLPTAISALLYCGDDFPTKRGANDALGSRLLDLLLDFPEIGVERIAEIKEAA